jgi:hypothetical protein
VGELILSSLPFVHLPAAPARAALCWTCLGPLQHLDFGYIACDSSCPACPAVRYCSAACHAADRLHPLECAIFPGLARLSDLAHLTGRLLLLLAGPGGRAAEPLPWGRGERAFRDLLSHSDRLPRDDPHTERMFRQLGEVVILLLLIIHIRLYLLLLLNLLLRCCPRVCGATGLTSRRCTAGCW